MLQDLSYFVSRVSFFSALICSLKGIATRLSLIASDLHHKKGGSQYWESQLRLKCLCDTNLQPHVLFRRPWDFSLWVLLFSNKSRNCSLRKQIVALDQLQFTPRREDAPCVKLKETRYCWWRNQQQRIETGCACVCPTKSIQSSRGLNWCVYLRTVKPTLSQTLTFTSLLWRNLWHNLGYRKLTPLLPLVHSVFLPQVEVEVESMDKAGNFIGWLHIEGLNLSVALVENALSKVHFTAERSAYYKTLVSAEEVCRQRKEKVGVT